MSTANDQMTKILLYLVRFQTDVIASRLKGAVGQSALDAIRKAPELQSEAIERAEKLVVRVVREYVTNTPTEQLERDLDVAPVEPGNAAPTPPPATPQSTTPEPDRALERALDRALQSERTLPERKPKGTWKDNAERMRAYRKAQKEKALASETPPAAQPAVLAAPAVQPVAEPQVAQETAQEQPGTVMSPADFLRLPEAPQDPAPAPPARPTPAAPAPLFASQQDQLPPHVRRRLNELKASSPEPANEPESPEPVKEVEEPAMRGGRRNVSNQIFGR
jgi:hypothetical protein